LAEFQTYLAGATTYSVTCDGDNTNIKGIISIL